MNPQLTPTALIVDDEFYNRDVFRIALESVGYSVEEAENGRSGLQILEKTTFTLLVLDLHMPVMNGRELLQAIRKMPIHKFMQVAVVTANSPMATDEINEIADFIMYKPIDVQAFAKFANRLKNIKTA